MLHSEMKTLRSQNFAILDGLRGIAAIAVMIAHITSGIMSSPLFGRKHMAVQFFFMLSGFVMMCAYDKKLRAGLTFTEFFCRRIVRLFPLIWVGTLLSWIYFANFDDAFNADPDRNTAVLFSALSIPIAKTAFSDRLFPLNPPEWSLFFELLIYAVFGLLARFASVRALVITTALGLVFYAIGTHYFAGERAPFWFGAVGTWTSFVIGMLLWHAHQHRILAHLSMPFPLLALGMLMVCGLRQWWPITIDTVLLAIVFPAMMMLGANRRSPGSPKLLEFLGELSYPLYIIHWPIMLFTQHYLTGVLSPLWTTVVACSLSVIVSWVLYIAFDKPIRGYLNMKLFAAPAMAPNRP